MGFLMMFPQCGPGETLVMLGSERDSCFLTTLIFRLSAHLPSYRAGSPAALPTPALCTPYTPFSSLSGHFFQEQYLCGRHWAHCLAGTDM